jgi:hypothetical protein
VGGTENQPASRKFPIGLTIAFLLVVGCIFSIGIALPLAASGDLTMRGFSPGDVMALLSMDIAATVAVIGLLVWAFLRLTRVQAMSLKNAGTSEDSRNDTRRQVAAPPESISSVTENTTRTLEGRRYETPRSL